VRDRLADVVVVGGDERVPLPEREAGEAAPGGELEVDERRIEAVHGGAAKDAPPGFVEVAVGRVGFEQLRDLVDEALKHRIELELAAQYLRRAEQRGLLPDALAVLLEQSPEADRKAGLDRNRLEQREVASAPRNGSVAVGREHADRLVLHDDRSGRDRPRPERPQLVEVAERRLGLLGRILHVGQRHGPLLERGERRHA
jgi:hypothetical protein